MTRFAEDFSGPLLDASQWTPRPSEQTSGCSTYFTLQGGQLQFVASPAGDNVGLVLLPKLEGDFDLTIAFEWSKFDPAGSAGCYFTIADAHGTAEATFDVHASGGAPASSDILFQYLDSSDSERDFLTSIQGVAKGRLRLRRSFGNVLEAMIGRADWKSLGMITGFSDPAELRISAYASSDCPDFTLSFDDLRVHWGDLQGLPPSADESGLPLLSGRGRQGSISRNNTGVPARQRVRVANRPPHAGRSTTPMTRVKGRVQLPAFRLPLQDGPTDFAVMNTHPFPIRVGVRTGEYGRDFTVRPNGSGVVKLPHGKYQLYYLNLNKPKELLQGEGFELQPNQRDMQIRLGEEPSAEAITPPV